MAAEVMGKRVRDVDASADQPKRLKKTDLAQVPEPSEQIKRAEQAYAAALANFNAVRIKPMPVLSESYLQAAIRSSTEVVDISQLAKDTGELYARQVQRQQDLQRAYTASKFRLSAIEESGAAFQTESLSKHNETKKEITALKERKAAEERHLRGEIERLKLQLQHYTLLSGVQITETNDSAYRFHMRVHQNELVLKVRLSATEADVETERATITQGSLPDFLQCVISLDVSQLPKLLLSLLNSLM